MNLETGLKCRARNRWLDEVREDGRRVAGRTYITERSGRSF
jgi:hypothetical protein